MKQNNRPGFTFIELFFVIVIGGIIFSLALITFKDFSPKANLSVEKQTVGSIKAGISFYHLDPNRGNMSAFPSALDSAAAGSTASSANPFFGQVLFEPVSRGWRKIDTHTWEAESSGNYYQYDTVTGVFGQVSAEAVPATTTTVTTTTTTVTTPTTTTTTTNTTLASPSVTTLPATNIYRSGGISYYTYNMSYDFGSAGSGYVQFRDNLPTYSGWVAKSGSGTYSLPSQFYATGMWIFWAQLKYGTTIIEGEGLYVSVH